MISNIFTKDCFKILTLFSISPGSKFNRKEIKEKVLLNNVPLDNALKRLLYGNILKKQNNYYSINFENSSAKEMMAICKNQYTELREIPLNVYFLIMDFLDELVKQRNIEVYLFGSYAKLVYNIRSDIDVAILSTDKINKKQINKKILKLEKEYGKNIEVHYFNRRLFYKNKKDPLVKEILKNGIKLL